MQSLKSESFATIFAGLPPKEVIRKCSAMPGSEDICSDMNNWKAYVTKRFSRKRGLQRPDLLTVDEWITHATLLEDKTKITTYNVGIYLYEVEGSLFTGNIHNKHPDYFVLAITVPGLPFSIRPDYHPVIFICDFQISGMDDLIATIGKELALLYTNIDFLESSSLVVERHLEILADVLPKAINLYGNPLEISIDYIHGEPPTRIKSSSEFISVDTTMALLRSVAKIPNGSMIIGFSDDGSRQFYINWWPVRL